jgi:hypothetical protein
MARPLLSTQTPSDRQASRSLPPLLGGHWSPVSWNAGAGAQAGRLPQCSPYLSQNRDWLSHYRDIPVTGHLDVFALPGFSGNVLSVLDGKNCRTP